MTCFILVLVAGLLAIPRLRAIGFFGATTTTPPDIEISRKSGTLGVWINPDFVPSLTADVDSQYSGRASTSTPTYGPSAGEDLFSYFTRQGPAQSTLGSSTKSGNPL